MTKGNTNLKKAARELARNRGIKYIDALRRLSAPEDSKRSQIVKRMNELFDGSWPYVGDPRSCMFSIKRDDGIEEHYVFDLEAMKFLPSMTFRNGDMFIFGWISGQGFTISVEGEDFRFDRIDHMTEDDIEIDQLNLEEVEALHSLHIFTDRGLFLPQYEDDGMLSTLIADGLISRAKAVGSGEVMIEG